MAKRDDADPDRLVRKAPGRYRSGDGRFTVESGESGGWYVADAEREDELGMPLLRGPFATLAAARDAVRSAREEASSEPRRAVPPKDRPPDRGARADRRRPGRTPAARAEQPREPTWLERLPPDRRAEAERLVAGLRDRAVADAERLVRRELDGREPVVAGALLARRLAADVVEPWSASPAWISAALAGRGPLGDQAATLRVLIDAGVDRSAIAELAAAVAARAVELTLGAIEGGGFDPSEGRPPRGWRLAETDGSGEPTGRTIAPRG